jgi:hypothetical protein
MAGEDLQESSIASARGPIMPCARGVGEADRDVARNSGRTPNDLERYAH